MDHLTWSYHWGGTGGKYLLSNNFRIHIDNVLNNLLPTTNHVQKCCSFTLQYLVLVCNYSKSSNAKSIVTSLYQVLTANILVYGNWFFLESSDCSLSPFQFILQVSKFCIFSGNCNSGKMYISPKFNPITKRIFFQNEFCFSEFESNAGSDLEGIKIKNKNHI